MSAVTARRKGTMDDAAGLAHPSPPCTSARTVSFSDPCRSRVASNLAAMALTYASTSPSSGSYMAAIISINRCPERACPSQTSSGGRPDPSNGAPPVRGSVAARHAR
eukprot:scaffold7890_cov112-Isochrysis_galbana.AAC.3